MKDGKNIFISFKYGGWSCILGDRNLKPAVYASAAPCTAQLQIITALSTFCVDLTIRREERALANLAGVAGGKNFA